MKGCSRVHNDGSTDLATAPKRVELLHGHASPMRKEGTWLCLECVRRPTLHAHMVQQHLQQQREQHRTSQVVRPSRCNTRWCEPACRGCVSAQSHGRAALTADDHAQAHALVAIAPKEAGRPMGQDAPALVGADVMLTEHTRGALATHLT
jgi:hypothetical protein